MPALQVMLAMLAPSKCAILNPKFTLSPSLLPAAWQGVTAEVKATTVPSAKRRPQHPYDLGPVRNLHQICGDNPTAWLLPPSRPRRGGLSYPTAFDPRQAGLDFLL